MSTGQWKQKPNRGDKGTTVRISSAAFEILSHTVTELQNETGLFVSIRRALDHMLGIELIGKERRKD
jgi:hypothetical protein